MAVQLLRIVIGLSFGSASILAHSQRVDTAGGRGTHGVGFGQPPELEQQRGAMAWTGPVDVKGPKLTGGDYMSGLVQAYGRTRNKPTIKQRVPEIRPTTENNGHGIQHGSFGEQLGLAIMEDKTDIKKDSGSILSTVSSAVKKAPIRTRGDFMSSLIQAYKTRLSNKMSSP